MPIAFQDNDPADTGFQFLEDLSTAYWYSQVLFTALELELFRHMEQDNNTADDIAAAASCNPGELARLLTAMARTGLVLHRDGSYYNTQAASRFLVPGKPDYMGDFFLYRQYMRPQWDGLTQKVSKAAELSPEDLSYEERNLKYVAVMDTLVRQKAVEIQALLAAENISGTMVDIGGGAGSLVRAVQTAAAVDSALLFDIPEVIGAARRLYPRDRDWQGIEALGGDFRTHEFDRTFSLVCLSNFLHAYGPEEAKPLFFKAVSLLEPGGLLVIHDYFPDRRGAVPQKGALYDVCMMVNTFNGACHDAATVVQWCREAGMKTCSVNDLSTDTAVILAKREGKLARPHDPLESFAIELGFDNMVGISARDVVTVPWARQKCRFGCDRFGKGLQCPPHGMDHTQTRELLDAYSRIYLLRGAPPGNSFHKALLALEREAFLSGFHKAFVFGAGPCNVCPECPEDGKCRNPKLARPSMEGSGIDVYATAENAGISLKPVTEKGQYVTYLGLLLVE